MALHSTGGTVHSTGVTLPTRTVELHPSSVTLHPWNRSTSLVIGDTSSADNATALETAGTELGTSGKADDEE